MIYGLNRDIPISEPSDGKKVYRYGVNNELNGRETSKNKLINGIGLFCHEFSHTMGLPDIYATSGALDIIRTTSVWSFGI